MRAHPKPRPSLLDHVLVLDVPRSESAGRCPAPRTRGTYPGRVEQGTDVHAASAGRRSDAAAPGSSARSRRAASDRWAWRRAIRADPRKYRIYRLLVAVVGSLLVLLGLSTGWLPGPGGIPLVLLGLAVLASEFEWAHRLLEWARVKVHELGEWTRTLPRWVRALGAVATAGGLVLIGWLALTLLGVPSWLPREAATVLQVVPGVP